MICIRPNDDYDCDVVVAGGGPAGASVAARLARKGYDVVIAERHAFPRDKVCGDFVGPAALLELDDLGIARLDAYRSSNVIHRAALYLDGQHLIEQLIPELDGLPSNGRVVPRLRLDQWIWDRAIQLGARALEHHAVTDFESDSAGITVHLKGAVSRLRTRLIVGADGSASRVARRLEGAKPDRADRIVAVRAYYEDVSGPADRCDLYFSSESFPGYYWLFPTGDHSANVGVGMVLETLPPSNAHLADLLEQLVASDPALRERLAGASMRGRIVGWPLVTYNPDRQLVNDRVMLVGDAAGLINPLNGEGIQYALESGRWAADVAARGLAGNDLSCEALKPYQARIGAQMGFDMALANTVIGAIRNRALNPIWLAALRVIVARARRDPHYARIVGGILAGLVPAKEAISTRVIVGTIEQAVWTLGFAALWEACTSPNGAPSYARQLGYQGMSLAYETLRDPGGFLRWSFDVARHTARLGGHIVLDNNPFAASRSAPSRDQPQTLRSIM